MKQLLHTQRTNMKLQTLNPLITRVAATAILFATTVGTTLAQNHLVEGLTGTSFNLVAAPGHLSTPEGNSLYFWGYGTSGAQYSGPTLIVNQGATVTVTLNNKLPVPTSIVFPGQPGVTAVGVSGSSPGLLTIEAGAAQLDGLGGGVVTYTFTPTEPGTYMYHSGTRSDLQTEMGMVGALIVRPSGFNPAVAASRKAYTDAASAFDHEILFLLSDMDEAIHNAVEVQVQAAQAASVTVASTGLPLSIDMSKRFAVYWFMNGRCGPDTMLPLGHPSLPVQPYDCFPVFHPAEKVLMRVIGGGSDPHPLHHHGNHARMIAQDGRLLQSVGGTGADLGALEFTVPSTPGGTIDTIFSWTGAGLGWDPYGHKAGDPLATNPDGVVVEDPADHLKPFPVILPADQNIVNGMMYGGSPFLGSPGILPPGEGGFNPNNGFMFLWHSHSEKEIVNNDIFPGGMLTLALVEAWPTAAPLALGTAGAASARTAAAAATPEVGKAPASFAAPVKLLTPRQVVNGKASATKAAN